MCFAAAVVFGKARQHIDRLSRRAIGLEGNGEDFVTAELGGFQEPCWDKHAPPENLRQLLAGILILSGPGFLPIGERGESGHDGQYSQVAQAAQLSSGMPPLASSSVLSKDMRMA